MTAAPSKHAHPCAASTDTSWRDVVEAMTPADGRITVSIPTGDGHLLQVAPRFDHAGRWVGWRVYVFDRPANRALPLRPSGPDRRYRSALLTTAQDVADEVAVVLQRWAPPATTE